MGSAFSVVATLGASIFGLVTLIIGVLVSLCCGATCCCIYCRRRRGKGNKKRPKKLRSRKVAVTRATLKKQTRVAAIEKQKVQNENS